MSLTKEQIDRALAEPAPDIEYGSIFAPPKVWTPEEIALRQCRALEAIAEAIEHCATRVGR